MKDNALRVMLFLYIMSGCLVATDMTLMQSWGVQWTTPTGEPAGPQLRAIWEQMAGHDETIQQLQAAGEMDAGNALDTGIKSLELGLAMTGEMFKMMAGLHAFDLLTILGVPWPFVVVIQGAYTILLARMVLGYLPHISAAVRALIAAGRMAAGAARTASGAVRALPNIRFG